MQNIMALTEKTEGELPLPKYLRLLYVPWMVRSLHQERSWPCAFHNFILFPWVIRQKWKIRIHFLCLKCCFFCLSFQICQNKIFCFRLKKIFCMSPNWLGFLFSKKEKELYKPEWKNDPKWNIYISIQLSDKSIHFLNGSNT